MRKIVFAVLAAILVGGAYYGVFVIPNQRFRTALDEAIGKLPSGYSVRYAGAHYALLTHTAEIIELSVKKAGDVAATATIAKMAVKQPALDLQDRWNEAAANPDAFKPDQALPVAERITIQGLKIQTPLGSGSVANSAIDTPRIYPWALLHSEVPALKDMPALFSSMIAQQKASQDALKQQQEDGDNLTPSDIQAMQKQQLAAMLPLLRVEASILLGLGFDGFAGHDFDMVIPQPAMGAIPAGNLHAAIHEVKGGAFDRGLWGDNTITGLSEDLGQTFKISIASETVAGLGYREPLMRLLNGDPLSLAMLDGTTLGRAEISGLTAAALTGGPIAIQSATISNVLFDHGFLKSGAFAMTGLKQTVGDIPEPRSKAALQQLGLTTITMSMTAGFSWDADKKTASLHDVGLKIDELGALSANGELGNIHTGAPADSDAISLIHATIRYDDSSLINRLLGAGGKRSEKQIRKIRQQFATGLLQNFVGLQPDPKLAPSAQAVSDFATDPHSLTITLAPPMPVPLPDLRTIAVTGFPNLINVLGLSVSANQ
jgi:hypothetical protein